MRFKVLLCLLSSFLVSSSFAAQYKFLGQTKTQPPVLYFYQADSIEATGNGTQTLFVFETAVDMTNNLKMHVVECDLEENRIRYLLTKDVFKKGPESLNKTVSNWIPVAPTSIEESILNATYGRDIFPLYCETDSFDELVEWGRKALNESQHN